jgi:hypothetical protein
MTKNVGNWDRLVRAAAGFAMLTCSVMAPLPVAVRAPVFGIMGVYMLFSALAGTCLGYRLMGRSTCPATALPAGR